MKKLFYHPESDCLFEVKSKLEHIDQSTLDPLVEDVTDIPDFEERFRNANNTRNRFLVGDVDITTLDRELSEGV